MLVVTTATNYFKVYATQPSSYFSRSLSAITWRLVQCHHHTEGERALPWLHTSRSYWKYSGMIMSVQDIHVCSKHASMQIFFMVQNVAYKELAITV